MTTDDLTRQVDLCFGQLPRPAMFIQGTCHCDECLEHETTMQSFVKDDLPLDKLDNPGWDPICAASDEAFAYLVPGLVRVALAHEEYVNSFVCHLGYRVPCLSEKQRRSLIPVLEYLIANCPEALDNSIVHAIARTKEWLESGINAR